MKDQINKLISIKFNLAKRICKLAKESLKNNYNSNNVFKNIEEEIKNLQNEYIISIGEIYYLDNNNFPLIHDENNYYEKTEIQKKYKKIIEELDQIVRFLYNKFFLQLDNSRLNNDVCKNANFSNEKKLKKNINNLIQQYENSKIGEIENNIKNKLEDYINDYKYCLECHEEMQLLITSFELFCKKCGNVKEIVGVNSEDFLKTSEKNNKTYKSGIFNPNRHFHHWITHILAKEPENEVSNELIEKIKELSVKNNKLLKLLNVDDIRKYLQFLNETNYNKNVSLILKKLTGIGPPQLPNEICYQLEKIFSKIIEINEEYKFDKTIKTNRNYYPYYIYKILDSILPENDIKNRRVLFYIYIQGKSTIDKNDILWEKICNKIEIIKWKPTNRFKSMEYHEEYVSKYNFNFNELFSI